MSRVVFVARSSYGHINPTLSLVHELVNRGEEVFYLANEHFKALIESTSCVHLKSSRYLDLLYGYGCIVHDSNNTCKTTEQEFMTNITKFYDSAEYIGTLARKVANLIISLKPDYIIHDSTMYFMCDTFRDSGIPCISTRAYFAFNRRIFSKVPSLFSSIFNVNLQSNIKDIIETINQLERDSHSDYGHNYDYLESKENLNIVFTSREFQPYADFLDETYHFAGNSLSFCKKSTTKQNYISNQHRKTILISFGSWMSSRQNYLDFYKNIMRHFGRFNASFIMNIGAISKENFECIPLNFTLQNGINQLELLELADLFITHGGMNSASEALQLDTPMLVLPQFFDQFIVARQVEKTDIGRQYAKQEVDLDELEQLVIEMIGNSKYSHFT
jgi:MGT family glycosyltransferase